MKESHLILIAHGSKNPEWREPFEALLRDVRTGAGGDRIHMAYLQMNAPGLREIVADLFARGVLHIRVLPMLMSGGNHAHGDIPEVVSAVCAECPGLRVEVLPPIGANPRFWTLMREIVREAL